MKKPNVLKVVHQWIEDNLAPGDIAIDATVGNGHDTLFLAEKVGESGQIYGFDIQAAALESAHTRLNEAKVNTWVTLLEKGHESMRTALPQLEKNSVNVITYNLGYLPGHDTKNVITQPDTTLNALKQSIELLAPGGIITLVIYVGHPGGHEEAQAITAWTHDLDKARFSVERYDSPHQQNHPPFAIKIQMKS